MEKSINIDLEKILKEMDDLKDLKAQAKQQLDYAESEIARLNDILQAVLIQNKKDVMEYGKFRFGWVESKRNAFNQKWFAEEHPELFEEYKEEKTYRNFKCDLM